MKFLTGIINSMDEVYTKISLFCDSSIGDLFTLSLILGTFLTLFFRSRKDD